MVPVLRPRYRHNSVCSNAILKHQLKLHTVPDTRYPGTMYSRVDTVQRILRVVHGTMYQGTWYQVVYHTLYMYRYNTAIKHLLVAVFSC